MQKTEIIERLSSMRRIMQERGIAAVIIPKTDPHQSEYLAEHWQVVRFLSGFTGSAGTLVITLTDALLWTDSRYFIQAADQLKGTTIRLMKDGLPDTPSIVEYLAKSLPAQSVVGIDGMLFSVIQASDLEGKLSEHWLSLDKSFDVIDQVWTDRPPLPKGKIFVHDLEYCGESACDKISLIRKAYKEAGADSVFISPLDEIAWVLNIRCDDVKYNPVATAYLYISDASAILFIDKDKLSDETSRYLNSQGVGFGDYDQVKDFLRQNHGTQIILIDPKTTSATVDEILGVNSMSHSSVVAVPKALRNDIQLAGLRSAMERDGAAMVRAVMEMEAALAEGKRITEMDVDALLRKYRSQQPLFFDESFASIVGYGPHGAIVHYEATEETDVPLEPHGLLLIDSGAQYFDGTTDITRTIALGEPSALEKHDFNLVLKGMIALDMMVFPKGTRGAQLDVEARKYLWREGLGYLHGTGHGVGHFLNVHEGPQTIRLNNTETQLMESMVTSDEPGLYREGIHGVRCENLVLCVKAMTTEFGEFLKFETLTLFPFDLKLIDPSMLSDEEIRWINDYHAEVYRRVSPLLSDTEAQWLRDNTAPIVK